MTAITHSLLETAYARFHGSFQRERDPISLVHRYRTPQDQEVVAFIVSMLSYGNVRSILQSTDRILKTLPNSPHAYLLDGHSIKTPGFKHRFTVESDIQILGHWISRALQSHGSIQKFFLDSPKSSFREKISHFVRRLRMLALPEKLRSRYEERKRNMDYLVSDPLDGSACKRVNMFLRWVVRPADGIDLGLWNAASPSELYLPIDTHVMSVLKQLRWVRASSATWRVVEQATEKLRKFCPEDPIRYDFALCHLSMEGHRVKHLRGSRASVE